MELQALELGSLVRTVQRIDPLILMVDLEGCVVDRIDCTNDRLAEDLRTAASLRSVLSTPVCDAWLGLVRDALARREGLATVAIIDGRGHAMVVEPQLAPCPSAMIAIFPTTMCEGVIGLANGVRHETLLQHEWGRLECLSRGQLDTLRSVTMGFSNAQIAQRVYRTKRAIEWHIRFLNQLLGVNGREELATIGRDAGLCCFSDEAWTCVLRERPTRRVLDMPGMLCEPKPKPKPNQAA